MNLCKKKSNYWELSVEDNRHIWTEWEPGLQKHGENCVVKTFVIRVCKLENFYCVQQIQGIRWAGVEGRTPEKRNELILLSGNPKGSNQNGDIVAWVDWKLSGSGYGSRAGCGEHDVESPHFITCGEFLVYMRDQQLLM